MIKQIPDAVINLIKGLYITFLNSLRGPITVQYPDEKKEIPDTFRGKISWEKEKCIACMLCDKICPSNCLTVATCLSEDKKKKAEDIKFDMGKCAFCGFCVEMCPTDALHNTKEYELSTFTRDELLLDKEKL